MTVFVPEKVLVEEEARDYSLAKELINSFKEMEIPIEFIPSHNRIKPSKLKTPQARYIEAKKTLVIGVRKGLNFQSCKPSAHFQLPLTTSCPGMCQYCYLQTTLGKRPFVRLYVNQEEILEQAEKYIRERSPETTVFEGAATSDPLAVEPYSKALANAIEFFGQQKLGRFRFVTKFTEVESLLNIQHNRHTRFRFSLNSQWVIERFEHHTPGLSERLTALEKVARAGYPTGVIIAPIIFYKEWEQEYLRLLKEIKMRVGQLEDFTFELISHRYTKKAKNNILELFPNSQLPMDEAARQIKYGQFGYMKYVYPKLEMEQAKDFFAQNIQLLFPGSKIEYFI